MEPVHEHARVARMHGRHGGDAQVLREPAHLGAGEPVAPGLEGRPRDHDIGLQGAKGLAHRGTGDLALVAEIIVAADQRGHETGVRPEGGLERAPRTDRLGTDLERRPRRRLAAHAREELVDVMHDAQQLSHMTLRKRGYVADTLCGDRRRVQ